MLAQGGVTDIPGSTMSVNERLSRLRKYCRAWQNLEWTSHIRTPSGDDEGRLWVLYSGVWALQTASNKLSFSTLPSETRRLEGKQGNVDLDFSIYDFGLDPTPDLLVLLEEPDQ